MLLTGAVFLFNLFCGLVPCDPHHKPPGVLQNPRSFTEILRNERVRRAPPIVKTPNGALEGYIMKAMNGRLFVAFEGVQYGEAERWKMAKPAKPWYGLREAKKPGPECLQLSSEKMFRVLGSDNCLFLNIYTPQIPNSLDNNMKKYPVIVFIHGGAFLFGSGADYGPTYLLSENVILVTFNYRLGVLGFFSTGDLTHPGNLGLKDQTLALQYIHENIHLFGGNPANISLWGQSAGATCVHLHLISQKSKNYFTTAYGSSATAFNHWAVQSKETMREYANRLARKVGCERKTAREIFRCIQNVNIDILLANQLNIYDWFPFPPITFSATVEPAHPDAFLISTPAQAYHSRSVSNKPYIIGFTKNEGKGIMILLLPLLRMIPLRQMWSQIAPSFLQLKSVDSNARGEMIKKIESFYFQGQDPRRASINVFADMVSDRYINSGIVQGIQAHSFSGFPTYTYIFSYSEGNHNLGNYVGYQSKEWGVGHIEDITYLFNVSLLVDSHKQTDPDHQLSSLMINMLVNFAATGKPVYVTERGEHLKVWRPSDNPTQIRALQFDRNIKMIQFPPNIMERVIFWDKLKVPNMSLWLHG